MGLRVRFAERKFRVFASIPIYGFINMDRNINSNIDSKFTVAMPKKKLNYYQRWRLKHRPVLIYLSLEEYEALKQLADKTKLSYRELLYGAARDIKKLYEEITRKYADSYTNEIVKVKQDYEAKIAKLKQEYEARLKEEYNRGFNDGKKKMKELIFGRCEVRCRQ
jgi:predicted patatin/cPLA2 family phospholipase